MEALKDLGLIGTVFSIFLIIRIYAGEIEEREEFRKKLKTWWDDDFGEEGFRDKVKIFLEKHPFPRSEREKKRLKEELREVQIFLKKQLFREDKISFDLYEELSAEIEAKKEEISF